MKLVGSLLCFLIVFVWINNSEAEKINITGTVRDFWPCVNQNQCGKLGLAQQITCGKCHNDFERYNGDDRNMVKTILGSDRKPVYNSADSNPSISNGSYSFDQWFRDVPGVNIPFAVTLTLDSEVCDGACIPGVYGYTNPNFFPINGKGWGNYPYGDNSKNFAFTFEFHSTFTYTGKEVFTFTGDDDVWVFINNTLVVDLGGVHGQQSKTITLKSTPGLTNMKINQTYNFDIFFAERHTSASNFKMYTSLAMKCPWYDWCGVCQGDGQTCCECDDGKKCTIDTCNVTTGQCIYTDVKCTNNGSPCYTQSCNVNTGSCFNTTAVVCAPPNQCQYNGSCTAATGVCKYDNKPDGTPCDDKDACSGGSSCKSGQCVGSNYQTCPAPNQCQLDPICNTTNGVCMYPNKASSVDCNDGNPCTLNDKCNNGQCIGTPKVCSASDQCHVAGTCNINTGNCSNPNAENNLPCDDNLLCTTNDKCTNGVCGGAQTVCNNPGQCFTGGSCSASSGQCVYTPLTGTGCNDNNACTRNDTCISGTCTGSNPVSCPVPTANDTCHTQGTCDTTTGVCSNPSRPNGESCNTFDKCALNPTCSNGVCVGTTFTTCPGANQCQKPGKCISSTGQCYYEPIAEGTSCDDGNACTQLDSCRAGQCVGSNPVVCKKKNNCHLLGECDTATGVCSEPKVDNGIGCMNRDNCSFSSACYEGECIPARTTNCNQPPQCHDYGTCDGATGFCNYPKLNGTSCDDGNACTDVDVCIKGVCTGFQARSCPAIDQCHSAGVCNTATGACSAPIKPDTTLCNDGDACTTVDKCTAGVCTGYTPVVCPASNNNCQEPGVCNKASGACSYAQKAQGTSCDDNDKCSATSTCSDVTGTCQGSNYTVCPPPTQCKVAGGCDSRTGICNYANKLDLTSCNDGDACTTVDVCMNGECVGTSPVVCPLGDQCNDAVQCNSATGKCDPTPVTGRSCNDGDACTQSDTCSNGQCVGSNLVVCPEPVNNCHTQGTCNRATGVCSTPTLPEYTKCDDSNLCSTESYCITGLCTGANWTICGAPSQCQLPGTCDPSKGYCNFPNQENGFSCNDNNPCTTNDACMNGICVGGPSIICPSLGQCFNQGSCDIMTGECIPNPKTDGTFCTDNNACTLNDTCVAGLCTSKSSVVCADPTICHMAGICDPTDGLCFFPKVEDGTGCVLEGAGCTESSSCVDGQCTGQSFVVCAAPDQCHNNGTCNDISGECSYPEKEFSTPCNDSNLCTWNDACYLGSCKGLPIICNSPPQCRMEGSCNLTNGECDYPNAPDGSTCDDGNLCTHVDTCMNGYCVGSNPTVCQALDDCHDAGKCNEYTGLCDNPTKQIGTACNDLNACSSVSTCDAEGFCVGSSFTVCSALDQCHDAGVCNIATGECTNPLKPLNTTCQDLNACTVEDSCNANGQCVGIPVVCSAPDQCHSEGTCNSQTGVCVYPNLAGTTCTDNNACTIGDTCQLGICVSGYSKQCNATDQCHVDGQCNPIDGSCSNPIALNGLPCNDGDLCTTVDACLEGSCTGYQPVQCSAQDQCHDSGVCNSATGVCSNPNKQDGSSCSDNDLCTQTDECFSGVCVGNNSVVCPSPSACHKLGKCNTLTGICSNPLLEDGALCDDLDSCTGKSTCAAGVCIGSSFKLCPAIDQCHGVGTCDSASEDGECSPNPLTGSSCDDMNECTRDDTCLAGVCAGTVIPNCAVGLPPYILLTETTQSIVPTQTLWLPLYFHGYVNLPKFQVRVTNLPISDSQTYVFGYVQYPWDGEYTELYRDAQLSANETDYVAFKLSPPQNQLVEAIVLNIEVQYEWNGVNKTGQHIVTVPVIPSLGDFNIVSVTAPVGVVVAGESTWFPVSILALSRLLEFKVTMSSDVLSFTYPENTGSFSSFYADSFINVGEVDFVAIRVVAPADAEGLVSALLQVSWKGVDYHNQTVAVTFNVIKPVDIGAKKNVIQRAAPLVSVSNFDVVAPLSKSVYTLFEVKAGSSNLEDVNVVLEPVDGVDIVYEEGTTSVELGSLNAGKIKLAGIKITSEKEGVYTTSVTVTFKQAGSSVVESVNAAVVITSKDEPFKILINSLALSSGKSSIQSIPFKVQDNDMLTSDAQFTIDSKLPTGLTINQIPTGTNRKDSYFLLANTEVSETAASGVYPFVVSFKYTTDRTSGLQVSTVSMVLVVDGKGSSSTSQITSGGDETPAGKSKSGLYIGVGIGAGIAFVALVAVAAVVIKKRKTRRVFVFAEPQLQQFSK